MSWSHGRIPRPDAPELDAARAREAVRLALAGAAPAAAQGKPDRRAADGEAMITGREQTRSNSVAAAYSGRLSEHFDDKISALVAQLEGRIGLEGLAQIRAEARSSRSWL
jgi:hypothetical protein